MSKFASIGDHRDQVALLATESPYTNLGATAAFIIWAHFDCSSVLQSATAAWAAMSMEGFIMVISF